MRKRLILLAVVAITACDSRVGASFVAPPPSIFGTFKLRTFNGKALPTRIDNGTTTTVVILIGDTLTFNRDNTVHRATATTVTTPPGAPAPVHSLTDGSFTNQNGTLAVTLPRSSGGTFTVPGTFSGGATVTINDATDVWVYTK
jgi:hypothetical protein